MKSRSTRYSGLRGPAGIFPAGRAGAAGESGDSPGGAAGAGPASRSRMRSPDTGDYSAMVSLRIAWSTFGIAAANRPTIRNAAASLLNK